LTTCYGYGVQARQTQTVGRGTGRTLRVCTGWQAAGHGASGLNTKQHYGYTAQ